MSDRKIALVTGGSRGLGKDMAINIARKGLDVVLTYYTKKDEAEKVVAEIEENGGRAITLQLDTSNTKNFDEFFEKLKVVLKSKFNTDCIDYLVNNAGTGSMAKIGEATEEMFDQLMNIHLKGVYFLTERALQIMNDGGGIVNITSGLAQRTNPGYSIYGSLKAAVESLTRYEAKELGSRNIRANSVAPGAIATDFGNGRVRDDEQLQKALMSVTPLGRIGQADDIGGVVAFLCTDDAKWVNAQRIEVSGGQGV